MFKERYLCIPILHREPDEASTEMLGLIRLANQLEGYWHGFTVTD